MKSDIGGSSLTPEDCDEYLQLFLSYDGFSTIGECIRKHLFASTARVILRKDQVFLYKELDWYDQPTVLSTLDQDANEDVVTRPEIGKRLNHFSSRKVRRSLNRHLSKGGVVLCEDITVFAMGKRDGQIVISLAESEEMKRHKIHGTSCELLLLRGDSIPSIASSLVLRLTLGCVWPNTWNFYFTPTDYQAKGCQKPQAPTPRKVRRILVSPPDQMLLLEQKMQEAYVGERDLAQWE